MELYDELGIWVGCIFLAATLVVKFTPHPKPGSFYSIMARFFSLVPYSKPKPKPKPEEKLGPNIRYPN